MSSTKDLKNFASLGNQSKRVQEKGGKTLQDGTHL
jgi:hypothetical protein